MYAFCLISFCEIDSGFLKETTNFIVLCEVYITILHLFLRIPRTMILSKYEPLFYSRLKKNVRTSNILIPQPEVMMKHRKPTWLENHPQSCVALEKIHCVKISKRFRTITKRWRPHSSKKQPRLQMEAERPQASLRCVIRPTKGNK